MLGLMLLLVMLSTSFSGQANAAFQTYRPDLSVNVDATYWASYSDYTARILTVSYAVCNTNNAEADNVTITGAAANNGVTLLTATPYSVGHIHTGACVSSAFKYHVPIGVTSFSTNVTATANDITGDGILYSYPLNQSALVYAEHTTGNPAITVIDTNSMTIVDTFTDYTYASGNSHRIQVSPDGNYIWQGAGGGTGVVRVTNAHTGATVQEWAIGSHNGPTLSNWTKGGHHYLFFPSDASGGVIHVFDVEAQTFLGNIPVGEVPNHMWDTDPAGTRLWGTVGTGDTSRLVSYDISNVNLGILPTVKSAEITIGGSLHSLSVDLTHPRVFVGSSTKGLTMVSTTTNTVTANFVGGIGGTHNQTMSADGTHLIVGNNGNYGPLDTVFSPNIAQDGTRGPFLWSLNLTTLTVDKYHEFRDGGGNIVGSPGHQTYTHDSSKLLMSSTAAGYSGMYSLDPATFAITGFVPFPGAPHSIGIAGGSGGLGGNTY